MRQKDFHKQVRIVYRALRRKYGQDRVDDEALKLFKVAFPIALRLDCPRFVHPRGTAMPDGVQEAFADTTEAEFTPEARRQFADIIRSWGIKDGAACGLVTGVLFTVENRESWSRGELLRFLADICPLSMRIRKLTPRECGRLQGVSGKDIDTIENCGISRSAQYKLYGNSITSGGNHQDAEGNWDGPLFNIFRKLFIDTEPKNKKQQATQLSLW